jgi:hypothetical protein
LQQVSSRKIFMFDQTKSRMTRNGNVNGSQDEAEAVDSAPVLIGATKHQPVEGVRNVLITGGAGFM